MWPNLDKMDQSSRFNLARLWDVYGMRLLRYGGVTVVTTLVGLTTLFFGLYVFEWSPWFANLVSVFMSTPFAYYLNRRFVWEQAAGNHSVSREVTPFWIMTGIGFIVSTAAVWMASLFTESNPLLLLTQLCAFGGLWLVKFAFLEKYLWADAEPISVRVKDAA
jgi:putative flippase GtrA